MKLSTMESHIDALPEPSDAKRVKKYLRFALPHIAQYKMLTEFATFRLIEHRLLQFAALTKDAESSNAEALERLQKLGAIDKFNIPVRFLHYLGEYAVYTLGLITINGLSQDPKYGSLDGLWYGDYSKFETTPWDYVTVGCKFKLTEEGYVDGSYEIIITDGGTDRFLMDPLKVRE